MKLVFLIASVLFFNVAFAAETDSGYMAAKKAAETRYADDRKLCADESTSTIRMQCLRDAKDQYNKALAKAKTEHTQTPSSAACADCGQVISVDVVEKKGEGSPLGLIAGGVAGALLGHQVGGGTGKDIATLAGAAGGAYAGHEIEQRVKSVKTWHVAVRFENGDEKSFDFDKDPGFSVGTPVRESNGSIVAR